MTLPDHRRHLAHWWLDRCFLYVGRMSETKGVPQILRAWMKLARELDRCPSLWLVGGLTTEIEAMREAVNSPAELASYEAAGRIRWWGYLDSAGISTVMLKAHVLITHSQYEPGGRVVLEAMTQGIPVIATPHGFALEMISDWHNGFLIPFDDENSLSCRMGHFALQPLLRHAMGRMAQRSAHSALDQWNFLKNHIAVYESATETATEAHPKLIPQGTSVALKDPIPRGFGGVYPFEGEEIDEVQIADFFSRHCGNIDRRYIGPPYETGRSRVWVIRHKRQSWVVKQPLSTYIRRAMWDRGYNGQIAEFQRQRILGETLASSCDGAARLVGTDTDLGLMLRGWLEPAFLDASTLPACADLFTIFYKSRHPLIDLTSIAGRLDQEWQIMSEKQVLDEVRLLDRDWEAEGRPWGAWSPMSLRFGWRWMKLGLRNKWLSLPRDIKFDVHVCIKEESEIAEEERSLGIGFCHGDGSPEHVRLDESGNLVLIDCERLHPGYFGHDWANLMFQVLGNGSGAGSTAAFLTKSIEMIKPGLSTPSLLLSWFKWTSLINLCRAHSLMETATFIEELSRFREIQRIKL